MLKSITQHFKENILFWLAIAATVIVYFKSLQFHYISWDDPEMVFRNKDVRHFNLSALLSNHYVGNYIPLTMLIHAFNWLLFKTNVSGHHAVNILFHLINGFLVYSLTIKLFKNNKYAALTCIVFLLHPIQTETICWISELKNLTYCAFFLLSLIQYINFSESKSKNKYLLSVLFFILSCLGKSSAVVLPLSLLCIDIFKNKQISFKYIYNKLPFFAISILFGIINLKTQAADQFINYSHAFPYYERTANAGFALVKYLFSFILPYNLSVIYPYPTNKKATMFIGFLMIILIAFIIYLLYKKQKFQSIAIILFILSNLILVLQFIPFGEVLNADRYMYIPVIGFSWLLISVLDSFKIRITEINYGLIIILSLVAFFRTTVWQNSIHLYEDILKKYPNSFVALNSIGVEYMFRNNDDKALYYYNRAIESAPYNYKGFYNRGLLFLKNNNPKKALQDFDEVFKRYDYNKAHIGRASAYYSLMRYNDARQDANYVLNKDPKNHRAYFVLGNCSNDENDLNTAISYYDKALELNNEEPDYYFKRAIALGKQQKFNECMNDLNTCIEYNPDYVEAYYWRGVAKVNLKQNPCEDFKRAAENKYDLAAEAFNKFCK